MKSALMVSWVKRGFSSSAARLAVVLLMLLAALPAQADFLIIQADGFGTGSGNVSSISTLGIGNGPPAAINCGGAGNEDCFENITVPVGGVVVTLKATADADSTFVGWSGGGCSGTGLCVVTNTTTGDKIVTATFGGPTLSVNKVGSGTVTSGPAGISCGTTCTASYDKGTPVTLTAAAAAGYTFTGWSGADAAACTTTGPCIITMSAAKSVTATFTANNTYDLTVNKIGSGTVTSGPAGIDCGATCAASYASGTPVTLTAIAASGYTFTGWSLGTGSAAACAGTDPCNLTMGAASSVTATFAANSAYALTVNKIGSGTVTSGPAGIDCGTTCAASYASGTAVTLTAVAASGYTFTAWSGADAAACTTTGPCILTMSAAKSVTATFTANSGPYTLTVNKIGSGTVTSGPAGIDCGTTCAASFASGTAVTLTAVAASGYTFTGWSLGTGSAAACAGTGPCNLAMGAASSVTATFTANSTYALTVNKVGSGTVTSGPAGIDCGTTCAASFASGTAVTLTAVAAAGYTFTAWSGADAAACTTTGPCILTMSAAKNVTATFTATSVPYTLTVNKIGSGTVTSSPAGIDCGTTCTASYASGTPVTLTAVAASGYTFTGWSLGTGSAAACAGTGPCNLTMGAASSVTATFAANSTYALTVLGTGSGAGSVKSAPTGIDCSVLSATPTVCSYGYATGTLVALTATAAANNTFVGWLGDCSGTETCVVTMDKARNVTATFDSVASSAKKTLYLYKLGTGSGAVTSDPSGIDCPATGCSTTSASFDQDASVTLTATHAQGSTFTGWSGGGSAVAVNSAVVNGAAKTVTLTLATPVTAGQSVTVAYTDPTASNDGNAIQDIYGNDAVSLPMTSVTNLTTVPGDTSPPKFEQASVTGSALVMSYTDAANNLDAANTPAVGAFVVKVNAVVVAVNSVAVNGIAKTVTLTLASPVISGDTVTVNYTDPTVGNDANAIQDTSGNDAASVIDASVTNLTGAPNSFLLPTFALATVSGNTLVMSYTGPTDLNADNLPALGAFSVQVGGINGCIGSVTSCAVTMSKAQTVTATFDGVPPSFFTVHIGKLGSGSGTIKSSGISQDPIDCGTDCDGSFMVGMPVVLKAVASSDSKFSGWSGCSNNPSSTEDCYVLKTESDIFYDGTSFGVTATFNKIGIIPGKMLTVLGAGSGAGSVKSAPAGIDCNVVATPPTVCAYDYPSGTLVALTAAAATNNTFVGWLGDCSGTGTCVVTMDQARNVTATFDSVSTSTKQTLYLYKLGTGKGAVTSDPAGIDCPVASTSCSGFGFDAGTAVTLTATHAQGSTFTGWSGGGSAVAVDAVAVNSIAKTVTLTLHSAVSAGQNVTVAYTDPTTGNDGNAIQDLYGNDAVSLPVTSVTNLTGVASDTTPPNFVQATVNGNTLIMSYADTANSLDGTNIPDKSAFSVQADSKAITVASVAINSTAKTVTLTLIPLAPATLAVQAGQNVTVAYTDPTTGNDILAIQDVSGNDAASLVKTIVTNLTGEEVGFLRPTFALAKVDGAQLVMSYTGPSDLNDINLPAVGAFAVEVGGVNGCIGTATTCAVTMSKAQTIIATFDGVPPSFFTVHIGKMGTGNGTIKSSGISQDPINCGTDCDGSFSLGTPVVLKAVADAASNFTGWTGCTNTPSVTEDCNVQKTANDIYTDGTSFGVTASFISVDYLVTLTFLGNGTGNISATTSNSSKVCTGLCSETYSRGVTVTFTAAADPGSTFIGWGGSCVDYGQSPTCDVKIDAAKSVTATFGKSITINTTASPVVGGSVSCDPQPVDYGANSICTAIENPGYKIAAWSGCTVATGTTCSLTNVTATQNVTATFTNSYSITATANPVVGGTVSCTPNPVNHSSRSTCTIISTSPGYSFKNWSGDCSGATCSMGNVTSDKNVTANFTLNTYAVSATASPLAGGTVSCTPNPVGYGGTSVCTATATPNSGYSFTGWSGACSGTTSPCTTISITANQSVTALFVETSKLVTTTTLSASPFSPAASGEATTLTVRVIPSATSTVTPTGSVLFKNAESTLGTVVLSSTGIASYSGNFGVGLHSLSASYAGDTLYRPSQGRLSYQIGTMDTRVGVSTRPNRSQPGISVPVTVNVTSASNTESISGTVEVSSDGQSCSITLPATSCTLTFANKGTKRLTARYSGNGLYSAASGSSVHFVGTRPSITPILMLLLD